ncbi:sugar ABC transporter substrate-binding protein [Arthrobacter sp. NPDC056691]|uniref:sugar ABC transporter substrate-binding protein n=1 Tax=Arthrobacter sp. NPDC056691 TaxID=3345913 RepID=UPI00366BAF33
MMAAVGSLALTGCGGSPASTGGGSGPKTIGVALPDGSQTYWTAWKNGAEDEAKKLGVNIKFSDAKGDADQMNQQVSSLIASGVNGVAIAPVDVTANKVSVTTATDASIPLITGNRALNMKYGGPDGANPRLHTGFSDVQIGQKQGELVKTACGNIDPCQVSIIEGTLGSSPQIDRTAGLKAAIKDSPNIQVVDAQPFDYDATKAADVASSMLQKFPKLNVIAVHDDAGAVPAARAVAQAGKQATIKVVGIGGSKQGIDGVQSGTLFGTVWVSPKKDAATAVDALVDVLNGKQPQTVDQDGHPTVSVESVTVTKDNVAKYPGEW